MAPSRPTSVFSGGPDQNGGGYVPNITPDNTGIGYWSQNEIAIYLATGTTPIETQAGGSMVPIIGNMRHLSSADRQDMAEYLKSLPPVDAPDAGTPEPNLTAVVQLLPKNTATAPSPTSILASSVSELAKVDTVYAVAIKTIYIDRQGATPGDSGEGKLLPAAKMTVIARDGSWLQVRVEGWQQQGSPAAFYALEGRRILVAALAPSAIAKVVSTKTVVDASTGETWSMGNLTAWVTSADLSPDIAEIWSYSAALYSGACSVCHAEHPTNEFLANQWIGNLGAMKRFAALDDVQYRMLQAYLQFQRKGYSRNHRCRRAMIDADAACNAMLADWLAGIFSGPLPESAVDIYRGASGGGFLRRLAEEPAAEWGATRMFDAVTTAASSALAARNLSLSFTQLFIGVSANGTVSLYESAHVSASGRLFQQPVGDMNRLLRLVDLTVPPSSREPADHLSIELALLAECFRDSCRLSISTPLVARLDAWVPAFAAACRDADGRGFYAGAAAVLVWFVTSLPDPWPKSADANAPRAGARPW